MQYGKDLHAGSVFLDVHVYVVPVEACVMHGQKGGTEGKIHVGF